MIFEIGDSIEFCKVIFERDNEDKRFNEYFIGEI